MDEQSRSLKWYYRNTLTCRNKAIRRREKYDEIKTTNGCGNPECPVKGIDMPGYLYDFHHVNPDEKKYKINQLRSAAVETIAAELRKCTVLCCLCHRMETFGNLDARKFRRVEINPADLEIMPA